MRAALVAATAKAASDRKRPSSTRTSASAGAAAAAAGAAAAARGGAGLEDEGAQHEESARGEAEDGEAFAGGAGAPVGAEDGGAPEEELMHRSSLAAVAQHFVLCLRGRARKVREVDATPAQRVFGESHLEASAVLHSARFGAPFALDRLASAGGGVGVGGGGSASGGDGLEGLIARHLVEDARGSITHDSSFVAGADEFGHAVGVAGSLGRFTGVSAPSGPKDEEVVGPWCPVRDLCPVPALSLSPHELNRLAAALGEVALPGTSRPGTSGGGGGSSGGVPGVGQQRWAEAGAAVSVTRWRAWCGEVSRVALRVCAEVEEVRLALAAARETAFADKLKRDDEAGKGFGSEATIRVLKENSTKARSGWLQLSAAEQQDLWNRTKEAARLGLDARAYAAAGDTDAALAAFRLKVELEEDSEHGTTHFMMGEIHARRLDWEAAVRDFDLAVSFSPELGHEYSVRGRVALFLSVCLYFESCSHVGGSKKMTS